jgi:hypothetical protein
MQSAEFSLVLGETLLSDRKTGGGVRIAQRLDALSADGATTDYLLRQKTELLRTNPSRG